ncbi:MAG: methyltransferase domain-containing protein [Bacteroidota bacterium]|jgi:SAM-dependent methyltransferase
MSQSASAKPDELVWTPEMVGRFWAHEAKTPENYFGYQVGMAVVRYMRPHLAGARRIVDYGAGLGFLVDDLLASGYQCGAAEFGADAVDALGAKFKGRPGFLGAWQANQPVNPSERFHAAFLMEVVEHLYDAELRACLENIKALLAPGGLLLVTTPNEEDLSKSMIMSPETGRLFHRWQHVRSWNEVTLAEALRQHGFTTLACAATDFSCSPAALQRIYPLPLRVLRAGAKRALRLIDRTRKLPHLYAVARLA